MADDKKPEDTDPKATEQYHQAKKGVQDAGEIVTSAGGEPLSGTIADITDGDRRKKK